MFRSLQVPEVSGLRATDGGLSSVRPQKRTAYSCAGYEGWLCPIYGSFRHHSLPVSHLPCGQKKHWCSIHLPLPSAISVRYRLPRSPYNGMRIFLEVSVLPEGHRYGWILPGSSHGWSIHHNLRNPQSSLLRSHQISVWKMPVHPAGFPQNSVSEWHILPDDHRNPGRSCRLLPYDRWKDFRCHLFSKLAEKPPLSLRYLR